ncbi:hypothetical protein H0H93_014670, partial [Arthromyces matolae]
SDWILMANTSKQSAKKRGGQQIEVTEAEKKVQKAQNIIDEPSEPSGKSLQQAKQKETLLKLGKPLPSGLNFKKIKASSTFSDTSAARIDSPTDWTISPESEAVQSHHASKSHEIPRMQPVLAAESAISIPGLIMGSSRSIDTIGESGLKEEEVEVNADEAISLCGSDDYLYSSAPPPLRSTDEILSVVQLPLDDSPTEATPPPSTFDFDEQMNPPPCLKDSLTHECNSEDKRPTNSEPSSMIGLAIESPSPIVPRRLEDNSPLLAQNNAVPKAQDDERDQSSPQQL